MKKVTFATVEAWKECSKEMDKLGISYESGNEKDLTSPFMLARRGLRT